MVFSAGLSYTGLQFYRHVLDLRAYRQQILTADIANASTPGFKAVDLDFRAALDAATGGSADEPRPALWLVDDPRHFDCDASSHAGAIGDAVKYQTGGPVTLDGNSVDLSQEKVAAGENAVQYEAVASFVSETIKMLTVAIAGSGPQSSGGG
jgi:flagellar basal-body rod protein FlgB